MMQLKIVLFFMLLCGLFSTIAVASNDHDAMTANDMIISMNKDNVLASCIFGVKSVSMYTVMYTSDIPDGKIVQINNEFCNLINPSTRIFFITHGFITNHCNYKLSIITSILIKKNYTVFSLDWSDAACYNDPFVLNLLEYPIAVHNTRKVGEYLASYIKSLINMCNVSLTNIGLIGHSLGAHISGFAAKNLQESNYGKVPFLIGIDPAGPLFMFRSCKDRLCETDAKRVIVLHTSALGLQKSIAHLDLWFNNGLNQPECDGWLTIATRLNCSHNIAIMYLANILEDCVYVGVPIASRKLLNLKYV